MKFEETNAYRARAAHCAHQAGLTEDSILKKFWDDLVDDWLASAEQKSPDKVPSEETHSRN